MDKQRAERYVEILERFHPVGWSVVHICPGSEYTIGIVNDDQTMICSSKFIVGKVLYALSLDPYVIQGAAPRDVSSLMTMLDQFVDVGDHDVEILI